MTLVDTSIWIDHLRAGHAGLRRLLEDNRVYVHPFVVGELALGHLSERAVILSLLARLPALPMAGHEEVMAFVDGRRLAGAGIGWVDAHLLAAALMANTPLLTSDKKLRHAADAARVPLA